MPVIFGLIGLAIKVFYLALGYAALTLSPFYLLLKAVKHNWTAWLLSKKIFVWLGVAWVYIIALYIYAFSYWGYRGLGDEACIPIGNGYVVWSFDGHEESWIKPEMGKNSGEPRLLTFAVSNNTLCADFTGFDCSYCKYRFVVFNTATKVALKFQTLKEYADFATKNNLPQHDQFKNFNDNHWEHWGGLRWFLLP